MGEKCETLNYTFFFRCQLRQRNSSCLNEGWNMMNGMNWRQNFSTLPSLNSFHLLSIDHMHCLEPPAHQSDSHNIQHDIFGRALTCGAKWGSRAQSQNCRERCTYRWFSAQLFGCSSRPCLIARGVGCLWSIQPEMTRSRCKMVCAWRVLRVPLRCHAKAQPFRNASSKSEMDIRLFPLELVSVKTWAPNHTWFSKTVGSHPFPTASFFHVSNQKIRCDFHPLRLRRRAQLATSEGLRGTARRQQRGAGCGRPNAGAGSWQLRKELGLCFAVEFHEGKAGWPTGEGPGGRTGDGEMDLMSGWEKIWWWFQLVLRFWNRIQWILPRLDLWNGSTDTLGLIERQGQVKGGAAKRAPGFMAFFRFTM